MSSYKEIKINRRELARLHARAYRAQQKAHLEICGIFMVSGRNEIKLFFINNRVPRSYSYELDLREVRAVAKLLRRKGAKLLGSFHSHPISEAIPSDRDKKDAFFSRHELIYDVCGRVLRLWKRIRF